MDTIYSSCLATTMDDYIKSPEESELIQTETVRVMEIDIDNKE